MHRLYQHQFSFLHKHHMFRVAFSLDGEILPQLLIDEIRYWSDYRKAWVLFDKYRPRLSKSWLTRFGLLVVRECWEHYDLISS